MRFVLALVVACGLTLPAAAFEQPRALLEAIYGGYTMGSAPANRMQYFSERLLDLYAMSGERQAAMLSGDVASATTQDLSTFDPFIEGGNALLLDLVIGEPVVRDDRALATVSFHNFDHTSLLSIAMVWEAGGWKVDDIASLGSGENWLLSWLLQFDPFGIN